MRCFITGDRVNTANAGSLSTRWPFVIFLGRGLGQTGQIGPKPIQKTMGNLRRRWLAAGCCVWLWGGAAGAQVGPIAPDGTLPEPSRIQTTGDTIQIDGGTRSGGNLFHSFERFSVPEGMTAWFNTGAEVQNAITRVTGGQGSEILGTLRANGSTNLFLLNPNGILFGPNAQLQLGGAFWASTAEGLVFGDGVTFDAGRSGGPPLLSSQVPLGLQLGQQPAPIRLLGSLVVAPTQRLSLVGGAIDLAGGRAVAPQGQIDLISAAGGTVRWQTNGPIGLGTAQRSGVINLDQQAAIDASGPGGGLLNLQAGQVAILNGSTVTALTQGEINGRGIAIGANQVVVAGIDPTGQQPSAIVTDTSGSGRGGSIVIEANRFNTQGPALLSASTFASGQGGDIDVRATEAITLSGLGLQFVNEVIVGGSLVGQITPEVRIAGLYINTAGLGNGGSIRLNTSNLTVADGAVVFAPTFGTARGGDIIIDAEQMNAASSLISTGNARESTGEGGTLTIRAGSLLVQGGALLVTVNLGNGPGGALTVQVRDGIEIKDAVPLASVASGIFTNTIAGNGRGGAMLIETNTLTVRDGAFIGGQSGANIRIGVFPVGGVPGEITIRAARQIDLIGSSGDRLFSSGIATDTFTEYPAGNVLIETPFLRVLDGATLSSSSLGLGQGGDITIKADRMEISGRSADGFRSGLLAVSGRADLPQITATGNSGSLNLQVGDLVIRNQGEIAVNSSLTGDAGSLSITGDRLRLENGNITANTASGRGGNIDVQVNTLQMLAGSSIATNAVRSDGGNIRFQLSSLAALQNSDITANAQAGRGGRVEIQADTVVGTAFRQQLTPQSDITATSGLGANFSGAVQINTQNFNDESGLIDLPEDTLDPTAAIIIGCAADEGNRFVVTGRGGVPAEPDQPASSAGAYWDDVRWLSGNLTGEATGTPDRAIAPNPPDRPVPTAALSEPVSESAPEPVSEPIIEAQGWVTRANGSIALVANPATPQLGFPLNCRQFRQPH